MNICDVIKRFEELETELEAEHTDSEQNEVLDARAELENLRDFLAGLCGTGRGHQWRGDWYPVTLIRESCFTAYAQELAEDIGAIPSDASWPCSHINWEQAARELQCDYTGADFDGVTYYAR